MEIKWIRIATAIFDNRKIKQIETLSRGDGIIVIWFKLLCLAGNINDNGMLYFTDKIPYSDQMLSTEFGRPLALIQLAMRTQKAFGICLCKACGLQRSKQEQQNADTVCN